MLGCIRLCLTASIQTKTANLTWAHNLWANLKKDYATPGMSLVFSEFQGVMGTRVPSDSHPRGAIDKIMAHYEVLATNSLVIPSSLQAMILLSKLPQHYNFVVQDFLHNTEMSNLDVQKLGNAVVVAWDAAQSGKLPQPLGCGNVLKLSNVKRKFLTPTF